MIEAEDKPCIPTKAEVFDHARQDALDNIPEASTKLLFIAFLNAFEDRIGEIENVIPDHNVKATGEIYFKYSFIDKTRRPQWFLFGFKLRARKLHMVGGVHTFATMDFNADRTEDEFRVFVGYAMTTLERIIKASQQ